jgi:release factor glutamine methyltransferase
VLGLTKLKELVRVEEFPGEAYVALVEQRAARVPLQHLVGSVGFRWIELQVGPGVFIPRPETELVAGWAIDAAATAASAPSSAAAPSAAFGTGVGAGPVAVPANGSLPDSRPSSGWPVVVDLCTGSGAIALSVAQEVPGSLVHALELDPIALDWARRNDPSGSVRWHLGAVDGCLPELDGTVDVVVSNPPYVPEGTPVDREVAEHDPALALYGGPDGLDVVRQVEAAARRLLKPGGLVVVEHDVTHGAAAPEVFRDWADVADHEDLTGRPRFVTARWPG